MIFDKLSRGINVIIEDSETKKLVDRFIQIKLCKKYGWTFEEINNFPFDFYQDILLLENKENLINNQELQRGKKDFNNYVVKLLHQIKNKL